MRPFKKIVSILLSVTLIVSVFTIVPVTTASAETVQVFARKWVKAMNVTGDYFSFTDLYSNFIICRGNPDFDEANFNLNDTDNVYNRTDDISLGSLDGKNEIRLNSWDAPSGYTGTDGQYRSYLGYYTATYSDAQGNGKLYLSTNGDDINFNTDGVTWYAYTWETFNVEYMAAQAPYYDSTDEFGYVNGCTEHYVSGNRKFVAIEGTTDGHPNVRQVEKEEIAVPYFEFEQYGNNVYKLKKCNNTDDAVIYVPDTIPANYPVQIYRGSDISVIAGGAFKDNTKLETVYIGDKVNLIGTDQISQGTVPLETVGAFEGCTNLREVHIGETDASAFNRAEDFCFNGCTSLEYIEATTKKFDHNNDYYGGISELASDLNDQLTIRCYHDSSLAYWFANNNKVELEYHEATTPIHTYIANSDCIKWTWSENGGNLSAKVALKCSVCELRTEVEAELQPVPDSHPASCTDPVEGHYKAVAHFDNQEFTDHGYTYKCTIPGKAHTPATEGTFANLYKLDTSSGIDYELRQQFKCSVCNTEYAGESFVVEYHSRNNNSCTRDGNYDYCKYQNNYYRSLGNNDFYEKVGSADDVIIPAAHTLIEHAYVAPSCNTEGKQQYWECTVCGKYFSDADGKTEITDVSVPVAGHALEYHPKTDATETMEGNLEYWECTVCGKCFTDADGEHETYREYTVIPVCDMEQPLEYIDDRGGSASVYNAHKLKSTSTRINGAAGSFAVAPGETVTIDDVCNWTGNIELILCDGATLNITKGINIENGTLNIYGQEGQTGTLNISGNNENKAISVRGNIGIHGGVINTANSAMDSIYTLGSLRINKGAVTTDQRIYSGDALGIYGGQISVDGEIHGTNTVTIYLNDAADSLYARTYGTRYSNPENCGTITVRTRVTNGEKLIEADTVYNAGNCGDINGKTLRLYVPHEHDLIRHPATEPTAMLPGNIEYWECATCGKYFADALAVREIALADTVIAPLNAIQNGNVYAVGDTVIIPPGTKLFYFTSAHNQGAVYTFSSNVNLVVKQRESDDKEYLYADNIGNYLVNVSRSDEGYVFTGYFATINEVVNINGKDVETFAVEPIYAKESSVTSANWTWGVGENDLPTASITLSDFYRSDFGTPVKVELTQTITAAVTTDITDAANCQHDGTKQDTAVATAYDGRFTATQERTYTGTHDLVHHEEVPATCTEDGTIEHWECSVCGTKFFDEDGDIEITSSPDLIIDATGHDWDHEGGTWSWSGTSDDPEVTFKFECDNCGETEIIETDELDVDCTEDVAPGCTAQGHKTYTATYDYIYSDEHTYDIPALGHGNLIHFSAIAPTCDNGVYIDGNIEYWRCERCGKLYSDEACENEVTQAQTVVPYFVFEYNGEDEQFGVYGYNGTDTVVTIPDKVPDNYPDETLRGKDVEYIHFTAFRDNTNITKVVMGDKMKHIGWEAFRRCTNLREVVIGNGLKKIDSYSFFECPSLEKLTCTTTDGNIEILNFLEQNTGVTFCGYHQGAFHNLLKDRALLFVTITYIGIDAHTYDCEFLWKDQYDCYSASVYCTKCNFSKAHTPTVTVTETAPSAYTDGSKVYTATVEYEGHTFTDTKTETLPSTGVSYLDINGETQTAKGVRLITADTTGLDGGWYCADGNVTVNGSIDVTGDSKIILMDGATLTVTGKLGLGEYTTYPITVYRQSGDHEGRLIAKSIAASDYTQVGGAVEADDFILAYGDTTVYGGWLYITAETDPATPNNALYCEGNITIHGGYTELTGVDCLKTPGTFTIDGGEIFLFAGSTAIQADKVVINGGHVDAETSDSNGIGIRSFSDITINLSDPDYDGVLASGYNARDGVIIVNLLKDEADNIYMPAALTDTSAISGKLLFPAELHEHTLTHVEASDGNCVTEGNIEYWYCPTCEKYFTQYGATEITQTETVTDFGSHVGVHHAAVTPTYDPETETYTNGSIEHWKCSACGKFFSDESCETEITQADTVLPYFTYGTEGNEVRITGYNGADYEIVIPETIPDNYPDESLRGRTVTTIGAYVFRNNIYINSLIVGDNIQIIGYQAFKGCSNLEEVYIGSGIQCFSSESFFDCNAITDFWCTKTDDTSKYGTLFITHTFNRTDGFTFHGPHTGAFYSEAHTKPLKFNKHYVTSYTYLGTDAHTDDVKFEWLGCFCTGATAVCTKCDHDGESLSNITVTSEITKDPGDGDGIRTYTASVEYNGVTYTDSTNETIRCYFPVHSLTLGGDIGVNFYVRMTESDVDESTVKFEWNGKTETVPLGEAHRFGVDTFYKTTLYVSAAEMNDAITATLYCGDEQLAVHHYSVREYCDYVLSADYAASYNDDRFDYDDLATFVKSMLNYGAMAQKQFGHNTDNLANHDINYDLTPLTGDEIANIGRTLPKSADFDEVLAPYGVKYFSCSLLLRSKTTLRFYFEKTGTGTFSADNFKINGQNVEVKNYQDGSRYVYIEVADIPSPELANAYTISVGDVTIGDVSPLSYAKDVLTDDTAGEDLVNVITALYRYYEAANNLFV